jgi:predicted nucleic acid-binding protein
MFLLDTDWIIQALAAKQPAARTLERLIGSPVFVSYITLGEVYESAFLTANPQAHLIGFRHFLGGYPSLGLDDQIMERFAETRAFLRRRGQGIADLDLLIAATALQHDLSLLTFNLRHFARIPDLKLYQPG